MSSVWLIYVVYTLFCMERQVDFLILKTRPHTQELSLSVNMCNENVKLACVAIIIQGGPDITCQKKSSNR
jgi:hypothetical protein